MIKMRTGRLLLFSLVALLFTGCTIKPLELSEISNVEIEAEDGLKISVELTLYNPNKVKLELDDIDIDVSIGSVYIGKLVAPELTIIERKGDFKTRFDVKIKKQNMIILGAQLFSMISKKQIDINLKGSIHVKHKLLDRDINIDHTEKVKL